TKESTSNSLTLTAEYSAGTGYGDAFPGWSANLPEFPMDSSISELNQTYLSKGQGGFDADGNFHLFRLESLSAELQYHFPGETHCFTTLGHSELHASNADALGPVLPGVMVYDRVSMHFINLFHDFNSHIRAGVEYAQIFTHYVDGTNEKDERGQV